MSTEEANVEAGNLRALEEDLVARHSRGEISDIEYELMLEGLRSRRRREHPSPRVENVEQAAGGTSAWDMAVDGGNSDDEELDGLMSRGVLRGSTQFSTASVGGVQERVHRAAASREHANVGRRSVAGGGNAEEYDSEAMPGVTPIGSMSRDEGIAPNYGYLRFTPDKIVVPRPRFFDGEQPLRVPRTPLSSDPFNVQTFEDVGWQSRQEEEYRQKVGSLQFVACTTRPDISFACSKLGLGQTVWSDQHWKELDRCLAYLVGSRDVALEFGGGPESLELVGYTDADDAGDKQNRTSTGGYIFVLGGAAVSWASQRTRCATLSSTESEYVAAVEAGKEARRLRFLLAEFQLLRSEEPTTLFVDNSSAISVAGGMGLKGSLKHMERRHMWLQHMVKRRKLQLQYIPTSEQLADYLTKALHFPAFSRCFEAVGQLSWLADHPGQSSAHHYPDAVTNGAPGPSALRLLVLLATAHSSVYQPLPLSSTFGRVRRAECTSGMGLVLGGWGPVVLTRHADASWVDASATQRSSQGYTFSLGSGSVSWRSTRSSSVLSSSCEAEIYAGAMAAQELRWLTYLLTDLGEQPCSPPVLYVDNKAMIALCPEHRLEHRTKHIAL
ncbi:unnamed protein product, partial [Closterium sp. NIES-54]